MSVPASVVDIAAGRSVAAVWENELGGITFDVGGGSERCFVKWSPATSRVDLERERVRLVWARRFAVVPEVIGHGRDDAGAWLVMRALPGTNAIAPRWKADPATAVAAIGAGLRELHERLPVAECPFDASVEARLAEVRGRAHDPARWHQDHRHLGVDRALAVLANPPSVDRLVVCHGDTCAPNTLVDDAGRCCGHVDFGALGVADRWSDLAVATWSTQWNYGPGWERALLDAYGVAPDDERARYYRLLQDLGP